MLYAKKIILIIIISDLEIFRMTFNIILLKVIA